MMALILAFLIDVVVGDPEWKYHPVRLMGNYIASSEEFFRQRIRHPKLAGGVLAISLPIVVFFMVWGGISIASTAHPYIGFFMSVLGIYFSISVHDLKREALRIYNDLKRNDIRAARTSLSRVVGRDTDDLNAQDIRRAAVETVAESTVDGIIAPVFYAALGGAPLALAYKAVNTLDSMLGYKNERYIDFGFFAAKQDDLFNWVPARLSYLIISVTSFLIIRKENEALRVGWKDGVARNYGNSAIPEATFAGALNITLGGPSRYKGILVKKPSLGYSQRQLCDEEIKRSIHLMVSSSCMTVLICVVFHLALFGI